MKSLKVTETNTHVYFLTGPFSQWHPCTFEGQLLRGGPFIQFNCAEQYMMASKAFVFNDDDTLAEILKATSTKEQKELGRKVKNFNLPYWESVARNIVFRGNWYKFDQNDDLANILLRTEEKILVEDADYDPVWGVGLAWNDPLILDEKNWKGTNWLGKCLMKVRNYINLMEKDIRYVDVFTGEII